MDLTDDFRLQLRERDVALFGYHGGLCFLAGIVPRWRCQGFDLALGGARFSDGML